MATLSLCEIFESQLSKTPIVDGQLVCCLDTGRFYRDTASSRIALGTDIVCVDSLPLAPIADILYLLKPNKLYYYDGDEWVEIIHTHANQDILDKIEVALTELMAQNYDAAYEHSISPHAPVDAEANVIESVQVNGTALTVVDKTVNVNVPTKLSELENDMGFTAGGENTTYDLEANTSADNGDVTIALVGSDGSIKSVKIVGDGSTLVTTDSDGIIVIDSAVGEYLAGSGLTLDGNVFNHSNSITAGTITSGENRTLEYGDTFTIPFVVYDAQGHITETGLTTMVMPSEPDDTKVTQSPASESENYPLLLAPAGQDSETTTTSYFNSKFYANPDTGVIGATSFLGDLIGTAEKAEKLATARTINGTSFDGTENIVTSYWGTSRSVTIGKTTKTVDGSVAMEWTLDEIGAITADSDTVGGVAQPVYVNEGVITALSANIGSGVKPVYLNSGIITASGSTVGSNTNPIYLDSGTLTPLSSTVGSGEQLMYLNAGTFTTSSSTVGSSDIPIYLNAGTLIPCGTSFSEIDEAINELIQEMSSFSEKTSNALIDGVPYYAVSTSPNTYPPHEADGRASVLGEMVLGDAILGVNGEDWTTEQPDYSEEQFTWVSYLKTNLDGSTYWTEPMLLTDDWTRSNAIEMMTKYEQLDSSKADKTQLSDGSVTRIGTDTIGSETNLIYLNSGIPTASSSTVGTSVSMIYLNAGTLTASSATVGSGLVPVYLNSGTITASTSTVGGTAQPMYLNSGTLTAISATVGSGTKPVYLNSGVITVSSSTVGSGIIPMYLSSGTLTASTSTVGSGTKPIYLNSGTLTASSSTVGTGVTPVYLNSGTVTAFSTTVGGTAQPVYLNGGTFTVLSSTVGSGTKPIYLNSGVMTASSSTVGSSDIPIYLNSGTLTACGTSFSSITSRALEEGIPYYAVSTNPNWYPPHESSGNDTSVLGSMTLGSAILGFNGNDWSTDQPDYKEGQYIWISYYRTRLDGSTYWTDPTLLTDDWLRNDVVQMSEEYSQLISEMDSKKADITALSDGSVTRLGTETIGSGINPIYLNEGIPVASDTTVGSDINPMYLSSGTLTASTSTVGSVYSPVYLNLGIITACAGNIIYYGTCSTATATTAKVVSCGNFTLWTGARISVKFTYGHYSESQSTLNVNSTGAKNIVGYGTTRSGVFWSDGAIIEFMYDGTSWIMISPNNGYNCVANGQCSFAEGYYVTTSGSCSHAEGYYTTVSGANSHAEGSNTKATNYNCHAEGYGTTASENSSHAEGYTNTASGVASHAEGYETESSNDATHAEGGYTTASGTSSHAEGYYTIASGGASHAEGYGTETNNNDDHAEGYYTIASGSSSHAEGYKTTASGANSHTEGNSTKTVTYNGHAEGYNTTSSENSSHAEGYSTVASGLASHSEGYGTESSEQESHAEGDYTVASGVASHAEGYRTGSSNDATHAEGGYTTASGLYAHAEGYYSKASVDCSHAGGYYTQTGTINETVIGQRNVVSTTTGALNTTAGNVFVIGNGTGSSALSNAFRVTKAGATYGLSAFNSSGADYAEFVKEWYDGNPDNEDRVGYFVTVKDELLYKANEGDYIVGITSGNPSVVGNSDENYRKRFEHDEFNRFIYDDAEEEIEETDENGNIIIDKETGKPVMTKTGNIIKNGRFKWNEDYDPSIPYIERKDRPEWDYVGMIGVLPVRDDGTCESGKYCKCGSEGVATLATERSFDTYYVIERISDFVISVILK